MSLSLSLNVFFISSIPYIFNIYYAMWCKQKKWFSTVIGGWLYLLWFYATSVDKQYCQPPITVENHFFVYITFHSKFRRCKEIDEMKNTYYDIGPDREESGSRSQVVTTSIYIASIRSVSSLGTHLAQTNNWVNKNKAES